MTERLARWLHPTVQLLLLGLVLARPLSAQHRPSMHERLHTSWGTKDGIPVGGVYKMASTPDGYLWLSANSGVLRFDGLRFTLVDSSTAPALASTEAGEFWPLLVDRDGTLWLSRSDEALVTYREGQFALALPPTHGDVRGRMAQDGSGTIWAITTSDWRLRRIAEGQSAPAGFPAEVPDTGILGMVADTGTGLWIGTRSQGLWHVRGAWSERLSSPCGEDLTIRPLLQSRDGKLWVSCDGLQYVDRTGWHDVKLPGKDIGVQPTAAVEDTDGTIWIATRGSGLLGWDHGAIESFSEADGLSDGIVHEVWVDAQGAVWTTTDGGLDRFRPAPFVTIDRRLGLPFDSPVTIFGGDDGSLWAKSYDERRPYHLDGGLIRKEAGPIRSIDPSLSRHPEYLLYGVSRDGGVWLTLGARLYHYRAGALTPAGGIALPENDLVFRLTEDARGNLWVRMTRNGLYVLRPGAARLVEAWTPAGGRNSRGMLLDPTGQLWLAGDNPASLTILRDTVLVRQLDSSNGLTRDPITMVLEGGDTLWGHVTGGDLMRNIGDRVNLLRVPEVQNLLRTASVVALIERGYLWVAAEGGIARMPLAALHRAADGDRTPVPVRIFNELDGLKVAKMTTLNRFPAFKATDGRLWFSTPAGLAVVDPASITPNPTPPLPHIEELVAAGRPIPRNNLLRIAPNPSRVEIYFTATGLAVPERATIEYRLDGVDRDWVRSPRERMVSYAGLRPHLYTFRVRAWNEDGIPGASEATLVFRVLPFWYQTWWFLAILLLLVASAGGLVFYAVQRARAQAAAARMQARFDATLAERTRLARELHDTLLQGFTGITLELQAMQRSMIEAPREAAITLARVLTTSDATLREARQMVWDMRAPELDHHDLAEALETAARQATADTPIALDIVIEGIRRRLDIGIETTALRIGREAVVNAVKHAEPTAITLSLSFADKRIALVVKDNGRGCDARMLEEAVAGGHWGIRGMQERAARSGGTLEISGGPGVGTEVALVLPLTT